MNSNIVILILSIIVIATYLLDFISNKIKIPSVLFLILIGLAFRFFADRTGFSIPYINELIPILGTVTLILIVLEGGLDLELSKEKIPIITKSSISAIVLILLSSFSIAFLYFYVYKQSFYISLVNAVPLSVISSAIAIPSVNSLSKHYKDFVVYESSLSDVFGIIVFNFILLNAVISINSFLFLGFELIIISVFSVILTFLMSFLLSRINHHIKFLPILAFVFIIYTSAKYYHLSPLIFILIFGLFLNNSDLIIKGRIHFLDKYLQNESLKTELPHFKKIVIELTFIFKVFFFIIFGYSVQIVELADEQSIFIALAITLIIFVLRYLFLKIAFKEPLRPLGLIAPRGLITILLALSIPSELKILNFNNSILIWVVFFTVIVLSLNVLMHKNKIDLVDIAK
jgi:NhaP-type Na+/H+ or K+/H+ antiporter